MAAVHFETSNRRFACGRAPRYKTTMARADGTCWSGLLSTTDRARVTCRRCLPRLPVETPSSPAADHVPTSRDLAYLNHLPEVGTVRNYYTDAVEYERQIRELEKRIANLRKEIAREIRVASIRVADHWKPEEIAEAKRLAGSK